MVAKTCTPPLCWNRARPMSLDADSNMALMAQRAYEIQAKVEDIVAGRVELKRQYKPPAGESLAACMKKLTDHEVLKQAVYDHLRTHTVPEACKQTNTVMSAEQTEAAAQDLLEGLLKD